MLFAPDSAYPRELDNPNTIPATPYDEAARLAIKVAQKYKLFNPKIVDQINDRLSQNAPLSLTFEEWFASKLFEIVKEEDEL